MFERFTTVAREAVREAGDEAQMLGSAAVGPEHLLIPLSATNALYRGLPPDDDRLAPDSFGNTVPFGSTFVTGVDFKPWPSVTPDDLRAALAEHDPDAAALEAIGISLSEVRRAVKETFGPDAFATCDGRLPFRAETKRALELSLREAQSLGLRHIDQRVLLLGVLAEPNAATELLARLDVDPAALYTRQHNSLRSLVRR